MAAVTIYEWNAATSENDVVLSPETEAPRTPESQEAEQTDVNQERLLAVEAFRGPKRTRSHSADSRSEGASDIVENKEDIKANDVPANENVELKHSTKPLSENVDDRVCVFAVFLFRSIEFSISFIIILVILHFVLNFFLLFSCSKSVESTIR